MASSDKQLYDIDIQVAYSRAFGPLELPPHMGMRPAAMKVRVGYGLYDISNLDANGDFLTDGSDFLYWQRYLGSVMPPTVASIPEPGAIGIAVAALVALACVRPRLMRSA